MFLTSLIIVAVSAENLKTLRIVKNDDIILRFVKAGKAVTVGEKWKKNVSLEKGAVIQVDMDSVVDDNRDDWSHYLYKVTKIISERTSWPIPVGNECDHYYLEIFNSFGDRSLDSKYKELEEANDYVRYSVTKDFKMGMHHLVWNRMFVKLTVPLQIGDRLVMTRNDGVWLNEKTCAISAGVTPALKKRLCGPTRNASTSNCYSSRRGSKSKSVKQTTAAAAPAESTLYQIEVTSKTGDKQIFYVSGKTANSLSKKKCLSKDVERRRLIDRLLREENRCAETSL